MNNFLLGSISLILLLEVSFFNNNNNFVSAQSQSLSPEGDARYYSTRYDNLDVETFFKSSRLLSNYIDCLLDKKPCPPEGKDLKRILPEALRTSCDQCTQVQKTKVLEIIKRLYFQYPDKYIALAERYDPSGKYTKQFETWFEQNSNFINDSEVTISNILTTRRRPVTKTTKTTTVRPTFSLKLKTTTLPPRSTTKTTTKTPTRKTASTNNSTSSRRPLSTRQTTSTSTTTTTSSPLLSPLSFLVTFPSSTPLSSTFRPQTQTFTNSFSVRTDLSSSQRPNILLTTPTTTSSSPRPTTSITKTTEKLIPTTSRTIPTLITTTSTTTVRNQQNSEDQFVPEFTSTSTSREFLSSSSSTTTRRTMTESTTTAFIINRDFDPTPSTFVTFRSQPRPQEGIDVIDNFFVPGGK